MRDELERLSYKYKQSERIQEQNFYKKYSIPVIFPKEDDEKGDTDGQEISNER